MRIGTVKRIELNEDFYSRVTIEIPGHIVLEDDTIASIKTAGLIGDRFVNLLPGGSGFRWNRGLDPGYRIADRHRGLIRRFAMGGLDGGSD